MSSRKLTILFAPCNFVGPVNACTGIAQVLQKSGHRIVFAVNRDWKSKLERYGFEEEILNNMSEESEEEGQGSAKRNVEELASKLYGPRNELDKVKDTYQIFMTKFVDEVKSADPSMEEIIARVKPDLIFMDYLMCIPSVVNSGIPWVWVLCSDPLCMEWAIDCPSLPPCYSSLSTDDNPNEWKAFRDEVNNWFATTHYWKEFNDYLISKNCEELSPYKIVKPSPYLNVYMYPKELDYTDVRPVPEKFVQFDNFKRKEETDGQVFEIPKEWPKESKVIYFSLGSMGSGDVNLMNRLLSFLAKSQHKFIVSLGQFGDQITLYDNMFGHKYLPQIRVLEIVDAVITHGGNNTVTETVYYGKPMIVLPIFEDQYSKGVRVEQKGFGFKFNPYLCSESEILSAIDRLFTDKDIAFRVKSASERIKRDNSLFKINELVHNVESFINF